MGIGNIVSIGAWIEELKTTGEDYQSQPENCDILA